MNRHSTQRWPIAPHLHHQPQRQVAREFQGRLQANGTLINEEF
jgi:hypothetical protein